MAWYNDGTIQVAANGTTATGTGTSFLGGVRVGDGITIAGSAALHEVTGVTSDTQLTFQPPYAGAAGSGLAYRVAPVLGYDKDLSDAFNQIRLQLGDFANSPNLQSIVDLQGASGQGLRFKAPGEIESFPLGNAASQTVTQGQLDTTAGRLLKVGDFGLGGAAPPFGGDLNNLRHGQTVYGNPATNGPTGAFYGWVRHTEVTPGEYSFQEAFDVTGKMWTRALNVRVWSDWDQVLTTRRLDPSTVVKGYGRGSGYVPGPGAVFPELTQDPANNVLPYISALEIRETGRLVNSAGPAEWVRPALTFHFGGYAVKRLSMDHNGQLWLGSDRLALVNADFERGANASGEYIKYPDGTLIVWGQRTVTPSSANAVSEHFFATAAAFNLNFPVACTCSGFNPELTNSYQILHHRIVATGQAQIRLQFNSSYVQPYGVAFIAIGRWK